MLNAYGHLHSWLAWDIPMNRNDLSSSNVRNNWMSQQQKAKGYVIYKEKMCWQ